MISSPRKSLEGGRDLIAASEKANFSFEHLRIFERIPDHHHGVVALAGRVVVFETDTLFREGVVDGALYVAESQHPVSGMSWEAWLSYEVEDKSRRARPSSPLHVTRQVVQMRRRPDEDLWYRRLASGFSDGPIHDWAAGFGLIGKVVGIYHPASPKAGRQAPT